MDYRHRSLSRPNITNNLRKLSEILKRSHSPPAKNSTSSTPSSPQSKSDSAMESEVSDSSTLMITDERPILEVDMERDNHYFNIGNLILKVQDFEVPLNLSGPETYHNDAFSIIETQAEISSRNFFSLVVELHRYKFIAVLAKPAPGIISHFLTKAKRIRSQDGLDDLLITLLYSEKFECLLLKECSIYPLEIVSTLEAVSVFSEFKEKRLEDCISISY